MSIAVSPQSPRAGVLIHEPREADERMLRVMELVPPSLGTRFAARWLRPLMIVLICGLMYVPWQQSVKGYGRVIAWNPNERPQTLQAAVGGRVKHVWVIEGQHVEKDQPLIEIEDNDPNLIDNLNRARASEIEKIALSKAQVDVYGAAVKDHISARDSAIAKARNDIRAGESEIEGKQIEVGEREAELIQARQNVERVRKAFDRGLASRNDLEIAERGFATATQKFEKSKNDVDIKMAEVDSKRSDLAKIDSEYAAKIKDTSAKVQEAEQKVQEGQKQLAYIETTINRQDQIIVAPRDGVIHKVWVNNNAEMLKQGDRLVTIVPDTDQRAVELFVDGNDASLIQNISLNQNQFAAAVDGAGQSCRLQFEGWPAIQFAGWPSVAVGTFGGKVALVDPTDDGKGKFRIVIVPHKTMARDVDWPSGRFLRQGVRANGWVLLNQVPIGWELWRQLNGFPPVIDSVEPEDIKKPKVPK
jgi:membrane fusion protein, adhesin transport system